MYIYIYVYVCMNMYMYICNYTCSSTLVTGGEANISAWFNITWVYMNQKNNNNKISSKQYIYMILVNINACKYIIIRINISTYIYIYTHPIFNQMFQNHDTSEATAAGPLGPLAQGDWDGCARHDLRQTRLNPPKNGNFQRKYREI